MIRCIDKYTLISPQPLSPSPSHIRSPSTPPPDGSTTCQSLSLVTYILRLLLILTIIIAMNFTVTQLRAGLIHRFGLAPLMWSLRFVCC